MSWAEGVRAEMMEMTNYLSDKDYYIVYKKVGHPVMSRGNRDRQVQAWLYEHFASLEEIAEILKYTKTPFWEHRDIDDDSTEEEIARIPYEEKRWGIYVIVSIRPRKLDISEIKDYLNDHVNTIPRKWRG